MSQMTALTDIANQIFESYDFGASVEAHDGWEWDSCGNSAPKEMRKIVYLEAETNDPDAQTIPVSFSISFDDHQRPYGAGAYVIKSGNPIGHCNHCFKRKPS